MAITEDGGFWICQLRGVPTQSCTSVYCDVTLTKLLSVNEVRKAMKWENLCIVAVVGGNNVSLVEGKGGKMDEVKGLSMNMVQSGGFWTQLTWQGSRLEKSRIIRKGLLGANGIPRVYCEEVEVVRPGKVELLVLGPLVSG
ncbi:unnamed protein product [Sphenostylis stenocarpa]|uniref:Uncharacterized protein n=1 Tax=Sphenostylis stenocarpa TaxID=92480 RepID=A0AA86SHK9_9FABA|nr:unnamed protein product [Sphenostylis stenocarpa]